MIWNQRIEINQRGIDSFPFIIIYVHSGIATMAICCSSERDLSALKRQF